ncbi:hypothetical protein CVD28_13390 [Bacillus sp. M6-12]|uniref:hypothetical protein n=1 Tax=Bacillus sp. M6-12 TaxID=2054166 RepID=UPI000C78D4CC|nr:hypothetical protein [Bacillus sp. M6-12]PLS17047.1 hypothetical protein CVD28_13390 [Bacillus sp. M6-12]
MQNDMLLQEISSKLFELNELLEQALPDQLLNSFESDELKRLLDNTILLYSKKVQSSDEYEIIHTTQPLPGKHKITQTDTAVFVDQLLKQLEIEVFELQMWRSMK